MNVPLWLATTVALAALGVLAACGDDPLVAPVGADVGVEAEGANVALQTLAQPDPPLAPGPAADAGSSDAAHLPAPCSPSCAGLINQKSATRYPLVLVHGAGGFEAVGPLDYFYRVPETLRAAGYAVYVATLDPFNASAVRAGQLAEQLDQILACTCAGKVNLVAHSQGGIDSRTLIAALGYGDRVASLTTLATPHRGTAVADMVLGLMPGATDGVVAFVLGLAGDLYSDPLEDPDFRASLQLMSRPGMEAFNAAHPDDARVTYYSWAGRAGLTQSGDEACGGAENPNPDARRPMFAGLLPVWTALGGFDGVVSDGLVPVASARWGRFRGCVAADHLSEVGQPIGLTTGFDHLAFFAALASFLVAEGH